MAKSQVSFRCNCIVSIPIIITIVVPYIRKRFLSLRNITIVNDVYSLNDDFLKEF